MAGRGEGVGVVVAEDPALPVQHVFVEFAGLLVVTQREQVGGELAGRGEGVGVVLAEDPAAAGEGVLVERAGLLVLTQRTQVQREVAGRGEGVGVIVAEFWRAGRRRRVRTAATRPGARPGSAGRSRRDRAAGWPRPAPRRGRLAVGRGQDMRQQPSPERPPARVGAHIAGSGLVEQPDHDRRPPGRRRDLRCLAAGAQQRRRYPVQLDAVRGHRGHAPPVQDRGAAAPAPAGRSRSAAAGRAAASGWSVSRASGTGSGPHQATTVSRSSAVGSSAASRSNATAHDAASDCG